MAAVARDVRLSSSSPARGQRRASLYARTDGPRGQRGLDRAVDDRLLGRRQDRDGPLRREPHVGRARRRARCRCATRCSPPRTATSTRTAASRRPASRRAAWNDATGGATQGGSTITQQYAKNAYLTQERTLDAQDQGAAPRGQDRPHALEGPDPRGLPQHHLLRSRRVRRRGRVAGVLRQAGQRARRSRRARCSPSILRSPGFYNPDDEAGRERLENRWNYVLDGMVEKGWLTAAERAERDVPEDRARSKAAEQGLRPERLPRRDGARRAARKDGFAEERLDRGGLRIVTHVQQEGAGRRRRRGQGRRPEDATPRACASGWCRWTRAPARSSRCTAATNVVEAVQRRDGRPARRPARRSSRSAWSPRSTTASRSTARSTARARCASSCPTARTYPTDGPAAASRNDSDGEAFGPITLLQATENSINTAYVDMNIEIGPEEDDAGRDQARHPRRTPRASTTGRSTSSASPRRTSSTWPRRTRTIANRGLRTERHVIAKVTSSQRRRALRGAHASPSGCSPESVMRRRDLRAAARRRVRHRPRARSALGRPAAGKTGTTDDNMSAWFVGYTPQLVTAVGMYREDAPGGTPKSLAGVGGSTSFYGGGYPDGDLDRVHDRPRSRASRSRSSPSRSTAATTVDQHARRPSRDAVVDADARASADRRRADARAVADRADDRARRRRPPTPRRRAPATAGRRPPSRSRPPVSGRATEPAPRGRTPTSPPRSCCPRATTRSSRPAATRVGGPAGRRVAADSRLVDRGRASCSCMALLTVRPRPACSSSRAAPTRGRRATSTPTPATPTSASSTATAASPTAARRTRRADPDEQLEYPVLTGAFMWRRRAAGRRRRLDAATACGGSTTSPRSACSSRALVAVWATARTHRRRPWDAAMVALAPGLLLAATINWDLLAVALDRRSRCWAWSRSKTGAGRACCSGSRSRRSSIRCSCSVRCSCCACAPGKLRDFAQDARRGASRRGRSSTCRSTSRGPTGWKRFYTFSTDRSWDYGSFWYALDLRGHPVPRDAAQHDRRRRVRACCASGIAALALVREAPSAAAAARVPRRRRVPHHEQGLLAAVRALADPARGARPAALARLPDLAGVRGRLLLLGVVVPAVARAPGPRAQRATGTRPRSSCTSPAPLYFAAMVVRDVLRPAARPDPRRESPDDRRPGRRRARPRARPRSRCGRRLRARRASGDRRRRRTSDAARRAVPAGV